MARDVALGLVGRAARVRVELADPAVPALISRAGVAAQAVVGAELGHHLHSIVVLALVPVDLGDPVAAHILALGLGTAPRGHSVVIEGRMQRLPVGASLLIEVDVLVRGELALRRRWLGEGQGRPAAGGRWRGGRTRGCHGAAGQVIGLALVRGLGGQLDSTGAGIWPDLAARLLRHVYQLVGQELQAGRALRIVMAGCEVQLRSSCQRHRADRAGEPGFLHADRREIEAGQRADAGQQRAWDRQARVARCGVLRDGAIEVQVRSKRCRQRSLGQVVSWGGGHHVVLLERAGRGRGRRGLARGQPPGTGALAGGGGAQVRLGHVFGVRSAIGEQVQGRHAFKSEPAPVRRGH